MSNLEKRVVRDPVTRDVVSQVDLPVLWRSLEHRRDASVDSADRLQGLFDLRLADSLERQIARISSRDNIFVQHCTLVHQVTPVGVMRRAQLQQRDHIVCPLQRPALGDQVGLQELLGRRLAEETHGVIGGAPLLEFPCRDAEIFLGVTQP